MAIENEKEKYSAYLCSREWAEKRKAVKERSTGRCERCLVFPMDACHHLTYERKYNEELADLQAICNRCHDFTHGKSDDDPARFEREIRVYFAQCLAWNSNPIPWQYFSDKYLRFAPWIASTMRAIDVLDIAIECEPGSFAPIVTLEKSLPFYYSRRLVRYSAIIEAAEYDRALKYFGMPVADSRWIETESQDDAPSGVAR